MITEPDTIARSIRHARLNIAETGGTASDRALVALSELVMRDIALRDPRPTIGAGELVEQHRAIGTQINTALGGGRGGDGARAFIVARARTRAASYREALRALSETGEHIGPASNAVILLRQLAEESDLAASSIEANP